MEYMVWGWDWCKCTFFEFDDLNKDTHKLIFCG